MHRIEAYIILSMIIFAIMTILYLPMFFVLKRKGKGFIRQVSYVICLWSLSVPVFAAIFFVIPITFKPELYILNLMPLAWAGEGHISRRILTEIIPNVLMFAPLGFSIPVVFVKMREIYMVAWIAFLLSLGIEFFQYFIGRSADIDDLLANIMGAVVGYCIYILFNYLLKNRAWWEKFTHPTKENIAYENSR